MTKRHVNVFSVMLVVISLAAFLVFLWFSTTRACAMSETELFENLIGTFKILENCHPSVATYLISFSLTILWALWIAYLICCIIISVRWFKEGENMTTIKIISIILWIMTVVALCVTISLTNSAEFSTIDYIGLIFNCLNVIVLSVFNLVWITEKKK